MCVAIARRVLTLLINWQQFRLAENRGNADTNPIKINFWSLWLMRRRFMWVIPGEEEFSDGVVLYSLFGFQPWLLLFALVLISSVRISPWLFNLLIYSIPNSSLITNLYNKYCRITLKRYLEKLTFNVTFQCISSIYLLINLLETNLLELFLLLITLNNPVIIQIQVSYATIKWSL